MNEDREIDRLFDPDFDEKDLIKSAKRKSYFRMTGVSFLVSICVLTLLILLKIQLTPYYMGQKMTAKELYYEIYGANIYTGAWTERYKLVGSSAIAPKYKLLNGKPVHLGEVSYDTPDIEVTVGASELTQFSYTGDRVMNFFHPSLQYRSYKNDLSKLDRVNDGKLIELALSFNKAYTYKEVVAMLPADVSLQWNWVNAYSAEELEGLKDISNAPSKDPAILKEYEVAGFPSISKGGEAIQDPTNTFIETLDLAIEKGGSYKEDFEHLYNTMKEDDASLTEKQIGIIGVVVVGNKQQLQSLIDKNYIKASSFGAIIDQY